MIDTSKNIKETLNYLVEEIDADLNKDFIYQEQYFISEDHNFTFNNIEKHLNDLYERTRMLQDVISYTRTYVKETVRSVSNECKTILDSIEDSVDSLKNKAFITLEVPFEESSGAYKDRSGVDLPKAIVQDSALTLSYQTKKEVAINKISKTKGLVAYRSNLDELKSKKPYRAFYMLDNPVKDGLIEEITVEFQQEETINYVSLLPSNCEVIAVDYINEAGTVDHLQNYKNLLHKSRKVKRIVFSVKCRNYETKTYYVDESRLKSNFWDKVKEAEYNRAIGLSSTLDAAQLDELAGLAQFRKDYESYAKAVEDWLKRRQEVVDYNESNGYSDSVPTIDLVVPPEALTSNRIYTDDANVQAKVRAITDTHLENEVNPITYLPTVEYRAYEAQPNGYDRSGNLVADTFTIKDIPEDQDYKARTAGTSVQAAALRANTTYSYSAFKEL